MPSGTGGPPRRAGTAEAVPQSGTGGPSAGAGRLAKNTAFNLLGYGLPLVFGLFSLPFIIRGLGTARFGVLSLVWVVLGYFSFLDLGLGRATIRFIADAIGRGVHEDIPEYLWTTVMMQFGLSIIGTIGLILLTPLLVEKILSIPAALQAEARSAFLLMAFSIPIVMISAAFRGVLEAAQRFDLVNAVKIPSSSATYLVPLAALFFWPSLTGIVALLLITRAATLVVWILLAFRIFPVLRRPVFKAKRLGPLLSFGGWATVSSLVGAILENLDRFAIGAFVSMQAVAYYTAPYEAVARLGILPSSLVTALFPVFSLLQGGRADAKLRELFARSVKIVTAVTGSVAVLIILLARPILTIWLGGDFAVRSGLVLQLIAASFVFLSFTYVAFSLLQGIGRTDLPARIHIALLVLYCPLLWGGIKLAGINGAAVAWTVHLGLQALFLFLAVRRLGLSDAGSLMRAGVGRSLFGLVVFAASGGILSLVMPLPAAAALATAGYLPLLWAYILNAEEKEWLKKLWAKARLLAKKGNAGETEKASSQTPPPCPEIRRAGASKPRLLLVGLVPPEAGGSIACGVACHVAELGRQASARGYDVSILAPLRPGAPASACGFRIIDASRSRTIRILSGGQAIWRERNRRSSFIASLGWRDRVSVLSWTERIRAAIETVRPDIIHIHPLSHPAGPGLTELPRGIPVVFTDHGFWQDLRDERDLAKVRETARQASGVIAVSRYCLNRQDGHGLVFGGLREIIRNPVTPPAAGFSRPPARAGRKRVLFVAGVEPMTRKGLGTLIQAFAGNRELRTAAELIVITEAEAGKKARRDMSDGGITGEIHPLRSCRAMPAAYAEADVFALPSRSEAFPLVFLEALAVGTPIVGFAPAVAEIREILGPDAGSPFDASTGTPAGLAEELLRTLERPVDHVGLAARTAAAFSWDAVFPEFERFYQGVRPT
ncbi:MAG: oligosaccharide flippase family protein [Acidobacteriota bacterium]|nr:oligosaccharide flippase family protein [Acidobacteriota bacterium]